MSDPKDDARSILEAVEVLESKGFLLEAEAGKLRLSISLDDIFGERGVRCNGPLQTVQKTLHRQHTEFIG